MDCFASLAMTEERAQPPSAAVVPRHRVSPSASPMTGSSGVSSTPRPFGSIIAASGILGHPLSRVMTTEYVSAISRLTAPEFCKFTRPKREGAGKTGCALHPRSRVQCAFKERRTRAYRFSGNTPAFPARWLYGLFRALPGDRLSCHRRSREALASWKLDTSVGVSGPHDFAVRNNIARPHARSARRYHRVHRIPRPTSVTIAIRPSCGRETGELVALICPTAKAEYFL
jgi:hypothetical protein